MNPSDILAATPVVPLVQAEDERTAVAISKALADGGLTTAEVVFRTDRALDCLRAVADEVPELLAGAGTVLNAIQAESALVYGAKFLVSPGLDDGVVAVAKEAGVPIYPGTMTASEIQHAFNLGLDAVKLFPASIAGGVPALKAFSSVFRSMKFMPTGGVSAENLSEYLSVPAVLACGGSWLTPADAIVKGDFPRITDLAATAVEIARNARP